MSEDFLSRWSRLKRSGGEPAATPKAAPAAPAPAALAAAHPAASSAPAAAAAAAPPLPPIESLEAGADIALFMRAGVEEGLKRQAFRKLLEDPRFNVMDGLDVYIDDYSKPDPLPEGWLEKMNQTARLGDYQEPPAAEETAEAAPPADAGEIAAHDGLHPEGEPRPEPAPIDTSNAVGLDAKRDEFPGPS